ncbi:MAG: hypothetical protein AAF632_25085 [Bacteroidota bacterium]
MNTKNWFTTLLGAGVVVSGLALTSCEDEFTEADAIAAQDSTLTALKRLDNENAVAENELDAQQELALQMYKDSLAKIGPVISYSVTVVAGGSSNSNARIEGANNAAGATVQLIQGGVEYTETANAAGVATFTDLRIGQAVVTVEAEDHTGVTFVTSLGDANSGLTEDNINTVIPVLPLTVEAGASEVSGTAWAELDLTNDGPEFAEGAVIRATMDVAAIEGAYSTSFSSTAKGGIQSASYTGLVQTATVGENGEYTLIVPNGNGAAGGGIAVDVEFLPFEATQTYVTLQGDSLATVTRNVVFGTDSDIYSAIEDDLDLPAMFLEIGAPTGVASDFALEAELVPTQLSNSIIRIDNRGADYQMGDEIYFVEDEDENDAFIRVESVDENGAITGFEIEDHGAEYSATPSLLADADQEFANGTGATFDIEYVGAYNIKIANEGTGYWQFPLIAVEYTGVGEFEGFFDEEETMELVNKTDYIFGDGEGDDIDVEFRIFNGQIQDDDGNPEDNIVGELLSGTMPKFTVTNPQPTQAVISTDVFSAGDEEFDAFFGTEGAFFFNDDDPGVYELDFEEAGSGYLTAPSVTVKTLGESMGSGATISATVSQGRVVELSITNFGSGYRSASNNVNTIGDIEGAQQAEEGNKTFKPGSKEMNFDYFYNGGGGPG